MSRHFHANKSSEIQHILHDLKHLSEEDITNLYGIEVRTDGTVYDPTYQKEFRTATDWAEFTTEQEEMDYAEEFGHGKQAHGDFY